MEQSKNSLLSILINALFPHQLADICSESGCRLIHMSTDCVFSGKKGGYSEGDFADANDIYGRTKYLGEINYPNTITLRTSIIGHELNSHFGLIEWFLSQTGTIKGFTNAIYTGFPTIELAKIIADYIIPDEKVSGLYHVSSNPISKYELLKIVSRVYKKRIAIQPYDEYYDNKSLISERYRTQTGYNPPGWEILIEKMYENFKKFGYIRNL